MNDECMTLARELTKGWKAIVVEAHGPGTHADDAVIGGDAVLAVQQRFADALAAYGERRERAGREAAAKVADGLAEEWKGYPATCWCEAAKDIARRIRGGPESTPDA
jgi:hypothetical protein